MTNNTKTRSASGKKKWVWTLYYWYHIYIPHQIWHHSTIELHHQICLRSYEPMIRAEPYFHQALTKVRKLSRINCRLSRGANDGWGRLRRMRKMRRIRGLRNLWVPWRKRRTSWYLDWESCRGLSGYCGSDLERDDTQRPYRIIFVWVCSELSGNLKSEQDNSVSKAGAK